MEERLTQEEKSKRIQQAEEKLRQAKAQLARAKREERERTRKDQNHHKFMIGGIVAKYFPKCYEFSEKELSRIIACAFKNISIQNMIAAIERERDGSGMENASLMYGNVEAGKEDDGENA